MAGPPIFTVGHSDRAFQDLVVILKAHGIEHIADVRSFPGSRKYPWFDTDSLKKTFPKEGISYEWVGDKLGGRRHYTRQQERPAISGAWRNKSFADYAEWMQEPAWHSGVEALMSKARGTTVAYMCSEAVPWRCHRSMITDYLLSRGWGVQDITGAGPTRPGEKHPFAKWNGSTVTYPAAHEMSLPEYNRGPKTRTVGAPKNDKAQDEKVAAANTAADQASAED